MRDIFMFIVGLFFGWILTISYLTDGAHNFSGQESRESITPVYSGNINYIKRDTVEYDQHPQDRKCQRLHWQKH